MTKKHERDMRRFLGTFYGKPMVDQTIRCYKGEQWNSFGDARFRNQKQIRRFVREISKYLGRRVPLKFLSAKAQWAWGGPHGIELPDGGHGRTLHTIVHEVSHFVAGPVGHDAKFIRTMIRLVAQFEGLYFARELEKRMYKIGALKRRRK